MLSYDIFLQGVIIIGGICLGIVGMSWYALSPYKDKQGVVLLMSLLSSKIYYCIVVGILISVDITYSSPEIVLLALGIGCILSSGLQYQMISDVMHNIDNYPQADDFHKYIHTIP